VAVGAAACHATIATHARKRNPAVIGISLLVFRLKAEATGSSEKTGATGLGKKLTLQGWETRMLQCSEKTLGKTSCSFRLQAEKNGWVRLQAEKAGERVAHPLLVLRRPYF